MGNKVKMMLKRTGIICAWMLIWYIGAKLINRPIVFVGPVEVVKSLFGQLFERTFWVTIGYSMGHIAAGFLLAFILGSVLGAIAYRFKTVREFLAPVFTLMKSIPVASFVILALIWIGSKRLSVFVGFLVVLPIIYVNIIAGFENADRKLLEMAEVFRISGWRKLKYIYRPAIMPFVISGCQIALGMCWKSGVAAEVIGVPAASIGERLYMAKIYLNTADLFAWTFVIIVLSALTEKILIWFLGRLA